MDVSKEKAVLCFLLQKDRCMGFVLAICLLIVVRSCLDM